MNDETLVLPVQPRRTVIFVRTSNEYDDGSRQMRECLAFCEKHHLSVAGAIIESGPGYSLEDRPHLAELRNMIRERLIDAVVVRNLGRLTNNIHNMITVVREAEEAGVAIFSTFGALAEPGLSPVRLEALLLERERWAFALSKHA